MMLMMLHEIIRSPHHLCDHLFFGALTVEWVGWGRVERAHEAEKASTREKRSPNDAHDAPRNQTITAAPV